MLASKLPLSEQFKSERKLYRVPGRGCPILPCGSINLKTGKNKYFNAYENDECTFEVWKTSDSFKIVCTSGNTPLTQIGNHSEFCHDQTHKRLFFGELVDYVKVAEARELIPVYGSSLSFFVYK